MTNGIVISLAIIFMHACTWDGMIFAGIKKIIKPDWFISKPIYRCPICMTPWWGTLFYFFLQPSPTLINWLSTIAVAAGLYVLYVCLLTIREAAMTYCDSLDKE